MTALFLAFVVAVLLAGGAYLIMRRGEIKLILGLALLSHGVNLLLFGTGTLKRGVPPILDKSAPLGDLALYPDPLPQALILTAIVISFGITAFVIVLVQRRVALLASRGHAPTVRTAAEREQPVPPPNYYTFGIDASDDDYEYLGCAPTVTSAQPGGDS